MIWYVALMDVAWLMLVYTLYRMFAKTNFARKLCLAMMAYVTIEVLFHVVMEDFVAKHIFEVYF